VTKVAVYEDKIYIPTYKLGPPSLNPTIIGYKGVKSYPYLMRDDLTDGREEVGYAAMVLENEYLRVAVLPELGGRLYSAFDKRNAREIFYRNSVIKPQLIGLTGAWFAGGLEWNFPRGHRPSTMETIEACCRENDDGSGSIFIGEIDKITGLRFAVELRLHPGRACIEETVNIHNPGDLPARYSFWSTSAERETEDTELRYPFRWRMNEHTRERHPWPYESDQGKRDLRWLKNAHGFTSIFGVNVHQDFFGTYDRKADCGVAHVASHLEVPGKKMWTWGMCQAGRRWNELLTDQDGPYVEMQSGVPDNQNEFLLLEGHASRTWKEYWFQAIGTGPFTHAGLYGAMSWQLTRRGQVFVLEFRVRANEALPDQTVVLANGRGVIHTGTYDFGPCETVSFAVELQPEELLAGPLTVALRDRDGRVVMEETVRENQDAVTDIERPVEREEVEPQGNHYSVASRLEKHGHLLEALTGYETAIAENPDCVESHLRKAIMLLKMGAYDRAKEALEDAGARDPFNDAVFYYRGLTDSHLGCLDRAKRSLGRVRISSDYFARSALQFGQILLRQERPAEATTHLRSACEQSRNDYIALAYLCYAGRKQGRCLEAETALRAEAQRDPLNAIVLRELVAAIKERGGDAVAETLDYHRVIRDDPANILAVASFYQEIGDCRSALEVVLEYEHLGHPILSYHAGCYHHRLGRADDAQRHWRQAEEAGLDYIFPNNMATVEILTYLLRLGGSWPKARYYLGLLYQARERYDEAIALWRECLAMGLGYSVLHCSLGLLLWRMKGDGTAAAIVLEQGLGCEPVNQMLVVYLNLIYREAGIAGRRRELISVLEGRPTLDQNSARTLLNLYNDFGLWDKAVNLRASYAFRYWEVDEQRVLNLAALGVTAYLGRAEEAIGMGRFAEAIRDLEKALELAGEDELAIAPLYSLGVCHGNLGELDRALTYYRRIAQATYPPGTRAYGFYLKALGKMVDLNWMGVE